VAAAMPEAELEIIDDQADADLLAEAQENGEAVLTEAVFDETNTHIRAEVEPVTDGLYTVIVPADYDLTPYLAETAQEPEADGSETEAEADGDEIDAASEDDAEIDIAPDDETDGEVENLT
jgi:hypothetical protein